MSSLPNHRQEQYARHRAKLVSKREAYRLAGYSDHHGNPARLDQDERVRKRIAELVKADEELLEVEIELMKRELHRIGYADAVAPWESVAGKLVLKDLTALPEDVRATISEIAVEPVIDYVGEGDERQKVMLGQKMRLKQHSKLEALKQLALLLGIEKPAKIEHSGPDGGPLTLKQLVGASYEEETKT